MYKLLIADDEALEREALRFFVEDCHFNTRLTPARVCEYAGFLLASRGRSRFN